MTREEAIVYGNDYYTDLISSCCKIDEKHKEFVKMSLKALEQEPCGDCVSRQAVLSMQYRIDDSATLSTRNVVNVDDIENLPPVTPQSKTEKVIKMREATPEERESVDKYVKSISKPTVVNFWDLEQEPKIGWISVDDKLPKNDEDVLVCFSQGGMAVAYYHIDDTYYPTQYADLNETGWFNEDGDALYFEPIAWIPLPVPFEPKPQENDHKCHTCRHYTSGEHDGSCGSYICKDYSNWESEDKEC